LLEAAAAPPLHGSAPASEDEGAEAEGKQQREAPSACPGSPGSTCGERPGLACPARPTPAWPPCARGPLGFWAPPAPGLLSALATISRQGTRNSLSIVPTLLTTTFIRGRPFCTGASAGEGSSHKESRGGILGGSQAEREPGGATCPLGPQACRAISGHLQHSPHPLGYTQRSQPWGRALTSRRTWPMT